jgi:hypothetical protein
MVDEEGENGEKQMPKLGGITPLDPQQNQLTK